MYFTNYSLAVNIMGSDRNHDGAQYTTPKMCHYPWNSIVVDALAGLLINSHNYLSRKNQVVINYPLPRLAKKYIHTIAAPNIMIIHDPIPILFLKTLQSSNKVPIPF